MKKFLLCISVCLLIAVSIFMLAGCEFPGTGGGSGQIPDYNADIEEVAPENITVEHFEPQEGETYYTSKGLSLMVSVNGAFLSLDYFSVEGSLRVYDNLYFYEKDYFYAITDDYRDIYAALDDSCNPEYAEVEREQGYDIQVNIKKDGKYKLTFDTETLKFNLQFKEEITEPVYYTIKDCSIYTLATNWVEMSLNPENSEEFVIRNFSVNEDDIISFYSNLHTSNYNITLHEDCNGRYASDDARHMAFINVGGRYDIYINRKTYQVRMELLNPDTASYSCIYYDGSDFIELEPYDDSTPYVFRHRFTVDRKYTTNIPHFYSLCYNEYSFSYADSPLIITNGDYHYFKDIGTYDIIINLKTFEIRIELLPE